jgi:radical SAM superfamily enzyme
LEKLYRQGKVPLLSRDEYVGLVVEFLERLNPNTIIHRLSGETYRTITVAPEWSIDKIGVHNAIAKALENRDTWQGRIYLRQGRSYSERGISSCPEGVAI